MTDSARFEPAAQPVRVRDFYLGRQPMLDRNQALFGYELLFRNAPLGPANITSGLSATASVIAHAAQLGLHKAIGDALGFLNVDANVLTGDIVAFLPRGSMVLEIVDSVKASDAMLQRIAQLASHGFRFALDNVVSDSVNTQRLLPLVEFVKVNLYDAAPSTVPQLVAHFKRSGKKLIAEKVETRAEYKMCLDLGFDYFQGYYFARPVVLGGRKLSPSQLTVMELMTLVTSEADNIHIERAVKREPTLAFNLLRLVNTPAVGARQRIESLSHAVMILGRRQLQRWLQIMLYAEPATRGHSRTPLLMLATTRGRLMELLAQRLRPSQRNVAEIAFTVGIMSLMDTLFEISMADLMEQIPVTDEVEQALLHRSGFFGELLRLAEAIECMEDAQQAEMPTLRELDIAGDDLAELEMEAFAWSDNVVRYAI